MKHELAMICGFLLAVVPAAAQSQTVQDKSTDPASKAQIVSVGEIVKIDAKKQSLQVKQVAEASATSRTGGRGGGRRTGSGGGGRRGGGGGARFPGGGAGGGGGRYPGSGGSSAPAAKQYKVFVTKDTAMKLDEVKIDFNDFHVGDHVTISGTPKGGGGDLVATAITRKLE